ncbi:MAG TPA: HEAT repeat domain-containing protein [Candidatus Sulfomarinibacteraceae bacterium]|nr:HEAT repeat domain-containing protein [Candidatus Sulfomarinibacteraceae bacterium]
MNSSALFTAPSLQFQFLARWQPDTLSLAIGLVLGIGLVLLVQRVLPHLRRWRDKSINRVQETQEWVRAGVEKRFQAETASYVRQARVAGHTASLEQIFVEPRLLAPPPPAHPSDENRMETGRLIYLWPEAAANIALPPPPTMNLRQLLLNGQRVVLSSPPGWGKSTLLAYCAYLCATADENESYAFLLPYIPVLVHLSELDLQGEDGTQDPAQPVASLLQQRAGPLTAPGIAALLREKLERGHVLLLIDGWDELSSGGAARVAPWLTALLEQFPQLKAFVAAAEQGYEPLLDLEFTLSGIAPWRAHHALQLGKRWAERLERSSAPRLDSYWKPGQTPLVTTMRLWLADSGNDDNEDSGSLTALLERALELLLQQAIEEESHKEAVRDFWQELAYQQLSQDAPALPVSAVQETASRMAREQPENGQPGALRRALSNSDMFVENSNRSVRLYSPLWRDFLAAAHMAQREEEPAVTEHLTDAQWRYALRFYMGHAGVRGFADRLLEDGRSDPFYEHLFTLGAWLSETPDEGTWRRRTLVALGQLVVRPDVPHVLRQRAIATLAACEESGIVTLLQQLLQRSDAALRQMAVAAIARFDPEQSVPLLEQMLRDGDAGVRVSTVHALGWQYSAVAERPLLETLIGRDDDMRRATVEQLALNGDSHWEILQEAAEDDDLQVRRAATAGLETLDTTWAEQLLQQMALEDEEWIVKSAASLALEARAAREAPTPWQPPHAADLAWMVEWAAERDRAAPGGPAAVTMLCELLASAPEPRIRATAALTLGQVLIYPEQRQAVWSALHQAQQNDTNGTVREAAFTAMAHLYRARGQVKT